MIRAGVAEVDITPPVGTCMLEPPGIPTTGVYESLFCRALVLDDGRVRVAVVTLDLLGMDDVLVLATQNTVFERTGIAAAHLMLTATHNHSAPVTLDCGQDEHRNRTWEADLVNKIAECVADAMETLQSVTLAVGREPVQIGSNRRISIMGRTRMLSNAHGPVIPHVDVLRVDAPNGDTLAVLFSHAAHPVIVHTASTQFNADYPGAAVRTLRNTLGESVVPMFAQGCAADINGDPLAGGHDHALAAGRRLGDAAIRAALKAQPIGDDVPIRIANREALLPFERIDPGVLDALRTRIEESAKALPAHDPDPRMSHDQQIFVQWVERVADAPPGLRFHAQGIAFGDDLLLLGMTHELFAAYGLNIDARSPFAHTMAFAYTNGCRGYVPTAEATYLGGYETDGAPKLFGLPRLLPDCETLVHAVVDDVMRSLSSGGA